MLPCLIVKNVRNPIFIFYLDKQRPVSLEKLPMMAEYVPRSFVCVHTHVCVCVFMATPFFLSSLVDSTLQRMEHLWMPGRFSQAQR
jgi:hypothetical protein